MRHRLFTLFSALSLLLAMAVGGMWVRSFFVANAYRFPYHGELCEVALMRGAIRVSNAPEVVRQALKRRVAPGGWPPPSTMPATIPLLYAPPASAATTPTPIPAIWSRSSTMVAPLLTVLLLVPPALTARKWRDRRRLRQAGLCPTCGYDLRATPTRCPECGAVPTPR